MVSPEDQKSISNTPAEWEAWRAESEADYLNYQRFEELSAPHVAAMIDFIRPIIQRGGELLRPAFEAEPPAFTADSPEQAFTEAMLSFLSVALWETEGGLSQVRPTHELTAEHVMAWFICKNGGAS